MSKIITLSYTNNFKSISDNQSQSLRIHCVSVRLNKEELELLNASRGDKRKGEWLRMASLQKLPPAIPAINLEVWQSLTTISQKLNKLIDHLDTKSSNSELTKTEIFAVKNRLKSFDHVLQLPLRP